MELTTKTNSVPSGQQHEVLTPNLSAAQLPEYKRSASAVGVPIEPPDCFIPVNQWPYHYPSEQAWRALIFKATPRYSSQGEIPGNGLIEYGVIRRVNSRVLINPRRWFQWVDETGR